MKAIVVRSFGEPDVLRVEDVPVPKAGRGQILVKVFAAGVNPVEAYIRAGTYAHKPELPYTPGTDGAGFVEAVGPGVEGFKAGQRVYTSRTLSGSYAQYALCEKCCVHALPERVSFEQGAAIGVPYATAYRAIFQRGRAHPGETILIHGASGGVGVAAIQLARSTGLSVIGTAGSDRGLELVRAQGALPVDHRDPKHMERVLEVTKGRGPELIVEMLANRNLAADLETVAHGGRIVVVGSRGKVEIDPRAAMSRDAAVYGTSLWNATPVELFSAYEAVGDGLTHGSLAPVIGRVLPLDAAPLAHKAVLEPGAYGKTVLVP